MILVNNIVLTDKIRQSFIESGKDDKEFWDELMQVIADKYHFTKDELERIIDNSTDVVVPSSILKDIQ